jgi:hypothetical protein
MHSVDRVEIVAALLREELLIGDTCLCIRSDSTSIVPYQNVYMAGLYGRVQSQSSQKCGVTYEGSLS